MRIAMIHSVARTWGVQGRGCARVARSTALPCLGGGGVNGGSGGGLRRFGGGGWNGDSNDGHRRAAGSSWMHGAVLSSAFALMNAVLVDPAHARRNEVVSARDDGSRELTLDSAVNALWAMAGPIITNLGFSGMCGLAAGIAAKKVGQAMAVALGLLFCLVQVGAHSGFITVNWSHVHTSLLSKFDLNKDGKVDEQDFKLAAGKALALLADGVPSVGGFLAGFVLGFKM